jgi:hypothetical protein
MQFATYAPVPENVAQALITRARGY